MKKCSYSCKYGGKWIDGIFHRWVDTTDLDFLSHSYVKALVENSETGEMELVSPCVIHFYMEEE